MNIVADLILISALAAAWLTAGLTVDALPAARTARELRHRARSLSIMVALGATVFVAVPLVARFGPGDSKAPAAALLAAIPGLVVLTVSMRRLAQVRRGAGAFATAPMTPVPPALRAAAAHPLIAAPIQVTGLAALVGLPIAGGLITVPGADAAGMAISLVGLAVLAVGARSAIRHSRLSPLALAPITRSRRRPPVRTR